MDKVYISQVYVRNIGGIEEFSANLDAINIVTGDHARGKTSFLNALDIVLSGGNDPDLIRIGAEQAEVLLTLSDGVTIRKTMSRDGSELVIKTADGGKVKRPAEYLKTFASGMGFDPIGFLEAEPRDRADFLLKNLPLTFDEAEVNEAFRCPTISGSITLQKLNELRDGKYSERTDLSRQVRDVEGTISDMRKSLPADGDKDWNAERDRIQIEIGAKDTSIATAKAQIELEAEQEKNSHKSKTDFAIGELQKQIDDHRKAHADHCSLVDRTASETVAVETKAFEGEKSELALQLGTARAKAEQQSQSDGIRKAIEQRKKTLEGHVSKEMRLTETIKRLDALKHRKLKELPIEGLDITADSKGRPVILVGEVALEKLNRQQQLFVAIQAVALAAGRLPLIICEAAELNDRALEELGSAAKEAGLQMVLARWSQTGPLEVQAA